MIRRLAWCALLLVALAWIVVMLGGQAHASSGMMNVGTMMSPTNGAGGSDPDAGFAITTQAGDPLTTQAGSVLVTQDAP